MKNLIHIPTGTKGSFIKEFKPTGKPLTTHIKTNDGSIYFAPSFEFKTL